MNVRELKKGTNHFATFHGLEFCFVTQNPYTNLMHTQEIVACDIIAEWIKFQFVST